MFVISKIYTVASILMLPEVDTMLNWMKEIAENYLLGNELDGEDFHLGFDAGLPTEVRDLLLGKNVIHSINAVTSDFKNSEFMLDEHELAIG